MRGRASEAALALDGTGNCGIGLVGLWLVDLGLSQVRSKYLGTEI